MKPNFVDWLCRFARRFLLLAALGASAAATVAAAPASVIVIPVTGAIGPASADFVVRSLARAADEHAQLAVLRIDTPGGLDLSMRSIIQAILASSVPVASFIAPGGARAASAGTYIVYASHVAAMAPGTNLGAATPVQLGMGGSEQPAKEMSTETRKQIQDASAYMRGLAQLRGRNEAWAERAVRESVSLSANEALDQKVIDLVASDVPDLLAIVDGRHIRTASGERVLATKNAPLVVLAPDWRSRFLATITDPSVALILMMIGMYGLFFEFANPGMVLPGVAGAICLLIGLFALQLLPVNYVGLGLVVLGLGFLVAEMFLPTFGTLGIGGIVAFGIGALMLIDTDVPGFGIPFGVVAGLALVTAVFVFAVSSVALKARKRPVVSGSEAMTGSIGVMLEGDAFAEAIGWARVHGERWRVQAPEARTLPGEGARVRVISRRGLTLTVEVIEHDIHSHRTH